MKNKTNKEIRKISAASSLPLLIFSAAVLGAVILLHTLTRSSGYYSPLRNTDFIITARWAFVYVLLLPMLILILNKTGAGRKSGGLKNAFAKPRRSLGWCLKWAVITIGVSQLAGIILTKLLKILIPSLGLQENFAGGENSIYFYAISLFVPVIAAPFLEEMLFRGTLFKINREMGQLFAIAVSGLAFGLWHMNYEQFFSASLSGMFLCFIFIKTKSLIPCIAVHMLNNLLVTLQKITGQILSVSVTSSDIEFAIHSMFTNHPVAGIVYCACVVLLFVLLLWGAILFIAELVKSKRPLTLEKGKFQVGAIKKVLLYFSSPVTLITFALLLVLTAVSPFA